MKTKLNKQSIIVFKKHFKCLWKPFLVFFVISFLLLNWNKIFWVFDYRFLTSEIGTFIEDPIKDIPLDDILSAVWNKTKIKSEVVEKINSIEIPQIGITANMVFVPDEKNADTSASNLKKYLDKGVLHYPGSVMPGKSGQAIILGHSAPLNWPKINYDWVFSDLDKLRNGDKIIVTYNNREYRYKVIRTVYLEKGEELSDSTLTNRQKMLVLMSCWPPGKDSKRIAVEAILE